MSGGAARKAVLQGLLDGGRLERVPASAGLAARLMGEARAHLQAAEKVLTLDAAGSLHLAYDAARKAAGALLAAQGLRATTRGGHVAVQEAAQTCSPAFRAFALIRRRRHDSEYPRADTPTVTTADAVEALERASQMVASAGLLLEGGRLRDFR